MIAQYTYDGEGKRISATEDGTTTHYLYDGLLPIIERNSSAQTTATYTRGLSLGGGIGGIISRHSSEPAYYHYDALGNVVNLTDSAGLATDSYTYTAFGSLIAQTGTTPNPYQFSTKPYNLTTGLSYFGARYYDSDVGRFVTSDPHGMLDGPNTYIYVGANPLTYIDLWGFDKKLAEKFMNKWLAWQKEHPTSFRQPNNCWGTALYVGYLYNKQYFDSIGVTFRDEYVGRKPADQMLRKYYKPVKNPQSGDIARFEKNGVLEHYATFLEYDESEEPIFFSKSGWAGPYEKVTGIPKEWNYGELVGYWRVKDK